MRIIDLNHLITADMPVYPGTEPPVIEQTARIERDHYNEIRLRMATHTGTHLDVPSHMLPGGRTVSDMAVDRFAGPAVRIPLDTPGLAVIGAGQLAPYEEALEAADFALLQTGWDRWWGTGRYFEGFPVLTPAAAEWLTARNLKGVGIDAVSADPVGESADVHHILLRAGLVIVENLTGLARLPESGFVFAAFPLKIEHADGSPVRAVGMIF